MFFQNTGAVLVADVFRDEASHVQEFGLPFASFLALDKFVAVALARLSVLKWRFSRDSVFVMCGCAVKSELCYCTVKPKLDKAGKC